MRQELVQRRVEQADGDGQAVHRLEDADEVRLLERLELGERRLAGRPRRRRGSSSRMAAMRSLAEEHVLGAAEADPLGAELAGLGGVRRGCRRWCGP